MKKNNSLVKNVVNFSFSKPLNLLIVVLLIIGILKDNAKKLPATTNTTQQNNTTIKEVLKEKINKIGQAIEMNEAIKQKQKERLGTKKGFIVVKPNCSIQCYVPLIDALKEYEPYLINISTYQAISGAGKTFKDFPEIVDNIIPYIKGEEEKSEKEPLKIWGKVEGDRIVLNEDITISSQCLRVPVSEGHMATVSVKFKKKPTKDEIISKWNSYGALEYDLPHKTDKFITYFEDDFRPQTKLDRNLYGGMGIAAGRLREDSIFDYKFIGLSHNTIRGAAGGAILTAELLYKMGYLDS